MEAKKPISNHKVVLCGETNTGKTALLGQYFDRTFEDNGWVSHNATHREANFDLDSHYVRMHIWDTAGSKHFRNLTKLYFFDVSAFVIVFDLTDKQSFEELEYWTNQAKEFQVSLIYIIGNKADLADQGGRREVAQAEAQEFAEKNSAAYAEVSAREHDGIEAIFNELAKALPNKNAQHG